MAKSHSVDEPRSADAVERTKRQRRPKATHKSIKAIAETADAQQECRSLSRRCQARSGKSLIGPAHPP
jgi:hypothetical protein